MMFIYKITEVENVMALREHLDVTFAENNAAAYTLFLRLHILLIWQLLNQDFHKLILK